MSEGKSGNVGLLLVLLVALAGAGGWNYQRNYQIEQAERSKSRFAGYDTAGLTQLADAYRSELAGLDGRYQSLRGSRAQVRNTQGVEEGVAQFERIQRSNTRLREVTTEVATREARVNEIDQELSRRASAASGVKLHLERLTGMKLPI